MKKSQLSILLLPFVAALPSCGGEDNDLTGVKELREVLAKQDLSPAYAKTLTSYFTQSYDVYSKTANDDVDETRFYTYRGGGALGCQYEVSPESYEEVISLGDYDYFDFMARGEGHYGMLQSAQMASYHYIKEYDEDEDDQEEDRYDAFFQRLETSFTDADVQVYNSLHYSDKVGALPGEVQDFSGIIDKKLLFDSVSVRAFSDIFARANLYDGQRSCEGLDRLYYEIACELGGKSDQELAAFIKSNHIAIEVGEENTLVRFKAEGEAIRSRLDDLGIIPGVLEGTLTYENATGKFASYEYQIEYDIDEKDEAASSIHVASMKFAAYGYSWNHERQGEPYMEPDPQVYEDADTFISDVIDEVIPPVF